MEISSFYTCASKIMITCHTAPEIWCLTNVIAIFFILGYFLPFYPPKNLKNENFYKLKKTPGDIIILHQCTKNHDHMLYCSLIWCVDRCNSYFSFWAIFCPFTLLTAQKIKISKKEKNTWRYHFTQVHQKL